MTDWPPPTPDTPLAVLVSGGVDSAVLVGEAVRAYPRVVPLYVRTGAVWEAVEYLHLTRFLVSLRSPVLAPVVPLELPVVDVYGPHWSLSGADVPDASSPDEAVYLPGRNVILLSKALIWCHLNGVHEVATAPLASNPFPDSTDDFYDGFAGVVSAALGGRVSVLRPYATLGLHKSDVLKRGAGMPLEHTFSCIRPVRDLHCGECNKCAERKAGFLDAGMPDPTRYAA
jgi:7-cyano-7-deazaguanine synthase